MSAWVSVPRSMMCNVFQHNYLHITHMPCPAADDVQPSKGERTRSMEAARTQSYRTVGGRCSAVKPLGLGHVCNCYSWGGGWRARRRAGRGGLGRIVVVGGGQPESVLSTRKPARGTASTVTPPQSLSADSARPQWVRAEQQEEVSSWAPAAAGGVSLEQCDSCSS